MSSVVVGVVNGRNAAGSAGRLAELEAVVDAGVRGFLAAGLALATIREERLYRAVAESWGAYVRARFGWSVQMAYGVESGARCARAIERAGLKLPAHVSPTMLRPLGPVLRERGERGVVEAWELVTAAAREDPRPLSGERVRAILAARGEPTVAIRRGKTRVQPIDLSVSRALARARALADDYAGRVPPPELCRHVSELAGRARELADVLERLADTTVAAGRLSALEPPAVSPGARVLAAAESRCACAEPFNDGAGVCMTCGLELPYPGRAEPPGRRRVAAARVGAAA